MDSKRLHDEGWQKRSIATEPRLSEMIVMYEQLGLEVCTEPTSLSDLPEQSCIDCFLVQLNLFRTIYTRPKLYGVQKEKGNL